MLCLKDTYNCIQNSEAVDKIEIPVTVLSMKLASSAKPVSSRIKSSMVQGKLLPT